MSRFLLCLAALLSATGATARAQTVVAGQVIDDQKRTPLAQLTVELLGARDTVVHAAVSASDGTFTLIAPSGGVYRVRFVADGAPTHVSDTLTVTEGEYVAREFPLDLSKRPFSENAVDKPVVTERRSAVPRYPASLQGTGVGGCTLVQFIIDTTGRVDRGTLRLLSYSHREFVEAVWEAVPGMRFTPAEVGGEKVIQLVEREFTFTPRGETKAECKRPPKQ